MDIGKMKFMMLSGIKEWREMAFREALSRGPEWCEENFYGTIDFQEGPPKDLWNMSYTIDGKNCFTCSIVSVRFRKTADPTVGGIFKVVNL